MARPAPTRRKSVWDLLSPTAGGSGDQQAAALVLSSGDYDYHDEEVDAANAADAAACRSPCSSQELNAASFEAILQFLTDRAGCCSLAVLSDAFPGAFAGLCSGALLCFSQKNAWLASETRTDRPRVDETNI
eukprot:TRINITY_DN31521_c0_g3_i1.p1 TRINITY_DN31521_c0_g3~~TRINITY_DN31521_c0_g3_i1.p1  ORF type:complete len:153 (-),score=17.02 TRINITY_DN31521_c0_g3_i1:357-752(-)